MELPDDLKEKINDFQVQMETFSDLCKFVSCGADCITWDEKTITTLQSVLYVIQQEAERIDTMSDEIFLDIFTKQI